MKYFFLFLLREVGIPLRGFQGQPEEICFLKWLLFLQCGELYGKQKGQIGETNQLECALVQAQNGGVWLRMIVVLMLKYMNDFQRDLESEFDNVNVHYILKKERKRANIKDNTYATVLLNQIYHGFLHENGNSGGRAAKER